MDWSSLLLSVAHDAFFAAIAGVGFALASTPSRRSLPLVALLAALGHALRFMMQEAAGLNITIASFVAALAIGFLSVPLAKRLKCPAGLLSFPALLPMIPGMYAYRAVLALVRFMTAQLAPSARLAESITDFFYNGLTAIFVMTALVVGVLIPLQLFRRIHFTRGALLRLSFRRGEEEAP